MLGAIGELRRAGRRLWRAPGYTIVMLVNLALGIGTFATIHAVVDVVLLQPLPYAAPDLIMLVQHEMPGITVQGAPTRFGGFQGQLPFYRERSRLIENIGLYSLYSSPLDGPAGPAQVNAAAVSGGYFAVLGLSATAGRLLADDEPNTEQIGRGIVALASSFWSNYMGADLRALSGSLRIDGVEADIAGVVEPHGPFPMRRVDVWMPRTERQIRATPQLLVDGFLVRVAAGTSATALRDELDELLSELPAAVDDDFVRRAVQEGGLRTRVTPLQEEIVGPTAAALWLLLAAGSLVLLAAAANAAGMQLLRRAADRREIAVRRAMGAMPRDLLRQYVVEMGLVAGVASAAGVAMAATAVAWLRATTPLELPRAAELTVRGEVVVAALGIALLATLGLALVGAAGARGELRMLRTASGRAGENPGAQRARNAVAAAELAIAVVLLVGAGLIVRSFAALAAVDPGFDAARVLTFRLSFPSQEIDAAGGVGAATPFYDTFVERLEALPTVERASYAQCSPFARSCGLAGLTFRPRATAVRPGGQERLFGVLQAAPGYHETLGIPVVAGRPLRRDDHETRTGAVVVSQSVATALWPQGSAVGKQLVMPDLAGTAPLTVVGVVGDALHTSLRGVVEPTVYMPVLFREQRLELTAVSFVVRTAGTPAAAAADVRATLDQLRPDLPLAEVATLRESIAASTARLRLATQLVSAAAAIVLLLGTLGVYGVVAYASSLRRSEFAVRLALGARAAHLRALVARQAAWIAGTGLAVGLAATLYGSRWLESSLYKVTPADPVTLLAVSVALGAATLVAAYSPARRAARTDPGRALRTD